MELSYLSRDSLVPTLLRSALVAITVGLGTFGLSGPAIADADASVSGRSVDDLRVEQQRLFELMQHDPTDYESTFRYARVSTALHDNEAAIAALDRLLFYKPDLTRVKYELGVLYFRLGSYAKAQVYFREALRSPDLDEPTRGRIATYLPEADKQTQQSQWSGFVQAGLRYQTNATFAPNDDLVTFGGVNLLVDQGALGRHPDWNAFGLGVFGNDYDFQTQRGDKLETRLFVYGTDQFRFSQYNVGAIGASIGPRFAISPEWLPGATVKPYIIGDLFSLGGHLYYASGGGGITSSFPVGSRLVVEPGAEFRGSQYKDFGLVPISTFGSGPSGEAFVGSTLRLTDDATLKTIGSFTRATSQLALQSFDQYAIGGLLHYEFDAPFAAGPRRWSVSPFAGVRWLRFDAPDAFVAPGVVRHDNELYVGSVADFALTPNFGLALTVEYDRTSSTIASYRDSNLSFMFGPTGRF